MFHGFASFEIALLHSGKEHRYQGRSISLAAMPDQRSLGLFFWLRSCISGLILWIFLENYAPIVCTVLVSICLPLPIVSCLLMAYFVSVGWVKGVTVGLERIATEILIDEISKLCNPVPSLWYFVQIALHVALHVALHCLLDSDQMSALISVLKDAAVDHITSMFEKLDSRSTKSDKGPIRFPAKRSMEMMIILLIGSCVSGLDSMPLGTPSPRCTSPMEFLESASFVPSNQIQRMPFESVVLEDFTDASAPRTICLLEVSQKEDFCRGWHRFVISSSYCCSSAVKD